MLAHDWKMNWPPRSFRAISADVWAGLSVGGLLLPEGIAYAAIAGLAPAQGVMAALAGGAGYQLLGRSRLAIVSPTSSSAALLAATIAALGTMPAQRPALAIAMAGLVALVFVALAGLRLGTLSSLISRPVLQGFGFGLAATIIWRQGPTVLGLPGGSGAMGGTPVAVMLIGPLAVAILLLLRRWQWPGPLIVLLGSIAAFPLLPDMARVGLIANRGPALALPALDGEQWFALARAAVPLALILFAESWGTMAGLAGDEGPPQTNRELLALGVANAGAALGGGMPVGAGYSVGNANLAAGARSRMAAVLAVIGLALAVETGAGLLARIPLAVVAAVVIAALIPALDPRPFLRLHRLGRDLPVAITAALGVLMAGVLNGMLIAVGLSVLVVVDRMARSQVAELGRIGSHDFVDRAQHTAAVREPDMLILRPSAPLFFGNADRIMLDVLQRAGRVPMLVLSLEETDDLDSSALDALARLRDRLAARQQRLRLARVHDRVTAVLGRAGLADLASAGCFSVADTVAAIRQVAP